MGEEGGKEGGRRRERGGGRRGGRGKKGDGRRDKVGEGEERREEVCHVYSMLHYWMEVATIFLLVEHFVGGAESHLCNSIV